jgi:pimeloyl-ACP methyl ester carboxylesterase
LTPLSAFRECRFHAQDNLGLYYRDYGDALSDCLPVICLPGLTRNSGDFHDLASRLAPQRRVICPDLRGRGKSDYDPHPDNYRPETYVLDLMHLLTVAGCHRAIFIGTSLGGILSMAMATVNPTAVAGVVLNDIGPEIDPRGLARIAGYVGDNLGPFSLDEATEWLMTNYGSAFPDFGEPEWRAEALRTFIPKDDGRYVQNYDPAISQVTRHQAKETPDLWPYFRALAHMPVLVLRGALSDILSPTTVEKMKHDKPDLRQATIPLRGHTPLLDESECTAAIDDFVMECDRARH